MTRFVRPESNQKKTLMIIIIGAFLMIVIDHVGSWLHTMKLPENSALVEIERGMEGLALEVPSSDNVSVVEYPSTALDPANDIMAFPHSLPSEDVEGSIDQSLAAYTHEGTHHPVEPSKAVSAPKQNWKKHAVKLKAPAGGAKIVIIIDDMGVDRRRSHEVLELDGPLTLAFLPYAPALAAITTEATRRGHELLIHVPMEPLNADLNPGPVVLSGSMTGAELDAALEDMFNSFDGYVGINNHMGSKMTQDEAALQRVMGALRRRGLIFVDSKTIHTSVAGKVAAENGLDYAERDVFLDHESTIEFVRGALAQLEKVALRKGVAIAIGHPKDVTIQALQEWLPDVRSRGFSIVPISAVVTHKESERLLASQPSEVLPPEALPFKALISLPAELPAPQPE